jgi:hypothetical protein
MTTMTVLGAVAIALGSASSAAAANLHYETHPSDLACPTQTRFSQEVTAKLGFSPWKDGDAAVTVSIDADHGRYVGRLVYEHDRERAFRADTCRRVADLLVTATAIALDRRDPVASSPRNGNLYGSSLRVATEDSPPPGADELVLPANPATEWAFAPRNNHFQLGAGFDSLAGTFVASGAIPLSRGHFDLDLGHRSDTLYSNATSSRTGAMARYVWPIFYINKNSSFEVPIYAGGGALYESWSVNGGTTGMTGSSQSKLIPEVAIVQGIQFRKLPVEFMFAMTLALADPPDGGSNFGVDLALRYVFRSH